MRVVNASGQLLVLTGAGGGGGGTTFSAGVSTLGNTLGNTGTQSNQIVLAGINNITLSQSTVAGGSATISISGPTQSTQPTVNAMGVSNTGSTLGNTGTSSQITFVIAASGNITASQSTAAGQNTIWLSVPADIAQTTQPAVNALGVSNTGNTAGNTGTSSGITWVLAGSNDVTLSQSTVGGGPDTVWIQGPVSNTTISQVTNANVLGTRGSRFAMEDHQHAGVAAWGITNTGNTAGTTGTNFGTAYLAATGGITASRSTGAAGNDTLWMSVPSQGTVSMWEPYPLVGSLGAAAGNASVVICPVIAVLNVTATAAQMMITNSISSSSNSSFAGAISVSVGVYTRNVSTLSLASSGSQSYQFTNTSNNSMASLSGLKILSLPINLNMTPGEYWIAAWSRTSTTNANWFTASNVFCNVLLQTVQGLLLGASNSTSQFHPGLGYYSASTSAALPASIPFSVIVNTGNSFFQWALFNNITF